jgi:hypothetical protein
MAIESFNEETQRAKVAAGWKGGPFYTKPILHPAMTIVDAVPAEVKAKMFAAKVPSIPIKDTK